MLGSINARETSLDLYLFYSEVTRRGGFHQVYLLAQKLNRPCFLCEICMCFWTLVYTKHIDSIQGIFLMWYITVISASSRRTKIVD